MKHFNKIVKSCAGTDWSEVIFNLKIRKIEQQVIENIEGIEWEGRFKGCSDLDSAVEVVWEIIDDVDSKSVTRQIETLLGEIKNEIKRREEMYSYLKPDEINQDYPRFRNCQHIDNSIERLRYLQEWLMSESCNTSRFVQEIIIERFRDVLKEHLEAQVPDLAEKIVAVTNVY